MVRMKPAPSRPSRCPAGTRTSVEDQLARRRGADPELVLALAERDAGAIGLDEERRRAPGAPGRVGHRDDGVDLRLAAVGDPLLGAVEDVLVAVLPSPRPHREGVGARLGLGEAEGGDPLAARHPRQDEPLDLVASAQEHRERSEGDRPVRRRHAEASPRQLLGDQAEVHHPAAQPLVLLGDEDRGQTGLRDRAQDVPREQLVVIELRPGRDDFLVGDLAGELDDLLLRVAELMLHHLSHPGPTAPGVSVSVGSDWSDARVYQRTREAAQVRPPPNAAISSRSPRWSLPRSMASRSASGIDADEVLPKRSRFM